MFDLERAILAGQFMQAAQDYCKTGKYSALPTGYSYCSPFFGNDLEGVVRPFGFLAVAPENTELIVAIRGTEGILEWLQDAEFHSVPASSLTGRTEVGFTRFYRSLTQSDGKKLVDGIAWALNFYQVPRVLIAGHSLGGALATLLAMDLLERQISTTVYTFGSPAVGDREFARDFGNHFPDSYRVYNQPDLVPHLPPVDYTHVEPSYAVNSSPQGSGKLCAHQIMTYLHMLAPDRFALSEICHLGL